MSWLCKYVRVDGIRPLSRDALRGAGTSRGPPQADSTRRAPSYPRALLRAASTTATASDPARSPSSAGLATLCPHALARTGEHAAVRRRSASVAVIRVGTPSCAMRGRRGVEGERRTRAATLPT